MCLYAVTSVYGGTSYELLVLTVTDSKSGNPVPLGEFETVNKDYYLSDSNGHVAFLERGEFGALGLCRLF